MPLNIWTKDQVAELRQKLKEATCDVVFPTGQPLKSLLFCKVTLRNNGAVYITSTQDDFTPERLDKVFEIVEFQGGHLEGKTGTFYLSRIYRK